MVLEQRPDLARPESGDLFENRHQHRQRVVADHRALGDAREVSHIAKRTVISDDALSVLVPILEEIAGFGPSQIRALFEARGLGSQEWDRGRTDWLTIRDGAGDGVIRLDAAANA